MRRLANYGARLEFKLEDMWVGIYWRTVGFRTDIWVCLLPCLPIHGWWWFVEQP